MSTYRGVNACLAYCLNSVLNVKTLVGAFNQEKSLVGAFSVITNLRVDLRFKLYRLPVVAGCPGEGVLEGGGEVEHGPGQDDVVVGAQKEGDHHGAHPRPPQDGAQPVQGACRDI